MLWLFSVTSKPFIAYILYIQLILVAERVSKGERKMLETIMQTNQVTEKEQLNSVTKKITVYAPDIAAKAQAGQFVIFKVNEDSERIPLTLSSWNKEKGTISHIFQEIGYSTMELGRLEVGQKIKNVAGPLGNASEIKNFGTAAVICGGLGTAVAYPVAKALKEAGNKVVSIMGARTKELFILEAEMRAVSDEVYFASDDGTKGQKGFVSDVLKSLIAENYKFNIAFAIGPPIMMSVIADITRPYGIKTIASLNPIMVDGMGMCGACRVSIDNKTQFACVDGPEFDAHKVNFKELMQRLKSYCAEEKHITSTLNSGGHCQCHGH
jgi:ferredoxin--NADP+ reductase